jgi:hypothetical protein
MFLLWGIGEKVADFIMEIIKPNGNEEQYDPNQDLLEFTTEITRAFANHPRIQTQMGIGVLFMLANDLHHAAISQMQQQAMVQQAAAKINADRIKRGGLG